jgi:predicted transposase/invertase (TIGR01784 family)
VNDNEKGLILPKNDIAFKSIFKDKNNKDVVEDFLKSVLDIPDDVVFEDIIVEDPELLPEIKDGKRSILDLRIKIPGQGLINVELQLCKVNAMRQRMVHYLAKTAASQLSKGDEYKNFNKTIMIIIADFAFIDDSESYLNRYVLYDKAHDSQFTDLLQFVIIELPKMPGETDHTPAWNWAKFFESSSHEEMREAAKGNEKVKKAMLIIEKLSADEAAVRRAEYEEMQRRDDVDRMEGAKREGHLEVARRMIEYGMDVALVAKYTGLSKEDIAEHFGV